MKRIKIQRAPASKPVIVSQGMQRNPKHLQALSDANIMWETPFTPQHVADNRAERLKDKQKLDLARSQHHQLLQLQQQQQQQQLAAQQQQQLQQQQVVGTGIVQQQVVTAANVSNLQQQQIIGNVVVSKGGIVNSSAAAGGGGGSIIVSQSAGGAVGIVSVAAASLATTANNNNCSPQVVTVASLNTAGLPTPLGGPTATNLLPAGNVCNTISAASSVIRNLGGTVPTSSAAAATVANLQHSISGGVIVTTVVTSSVTAATASFTTSSCVIGGRVGGKLSLQQLQSSSQQSATVVSMASLAQIQAAAKLAQPIQVTGIHNKAGVSGTRATLTPNQLTYIRQHTLQQNLQLQHKQDGQQPQTIKRLQVCLSH